MNTSAVDNSPGAAERGATACAALGRAGPCAFLSKGLCNRAARQQPVAAISRHPQRRRTPLPPALREHRPCWRRGDFERSRAVARSPPHAPRGAPRPRSQGRLNQRRLMITRGRDVARPASGGSGARGGGRCPGALRAPAVGVRQADRGCAPSGARAQGGQGLVEEAPSEVKAESRRTRPKASRRSLSRPAICEPR